MNLERSQMNHLQIEAEDRKAARAEAAMELLRQREPIADDYNLQTAQENMRHCDFDLIDRPAHYTQGGIECIDILEQLAADGHDFRILNAIKYLWRYRHKGGDESLRKAVWYIERALEFPND